MGQTDDLKATVVSLMPFPLDEQKVGVYPGTFHIDAALDGEPKLLVVDDAIHFIYLGEDRGDLKVRIPAHELAASIVYDYVSSLSCYTSESFPALFWVPGTHKDASKIPQDRMDTAKLLQKNWFLALVKLADDDWSKYHRHTVISDHQRHATKFLGLEREWLIQPSIEVPKPVLCGACKSPIHPEASICPFCRTNLKEPVQASNTLKEL